MNETTKIVIAGGGGLAIGLASGYILAVKTMQARIDSQIEEVKAHYAAKHEKYISETRAVMDEAIDRKVAEVVSERLGYSAEAEMSRTETLKVATKKAKGKQKSSFRSSNTSSTEEVAEADSKGNGRRDQSERPGSLSRLGESAGDPQVDTYEDFGDTRHDLAPGVNVVPSPGEEFDGAYPAELDDPDFDDDQPYLIKKSQYVKGDRGYSQWHLIYYDIDDLLVDEDNRPFPDINIAGDCLWMLDEHPVIHVRNPQQEIDMEITLSRKAYVEALSGVRDRKRKQNPRMRDDD